MKTIIAAVATAMLLASPVVVSDSAEAHAGYWKKHRYSRVWVKHHYHVHKRHHRWVRRGGVVTRIVVYPGCGRCW